MSSVNDMRCLKTITSGMYNFTIIHCRSGERGAGDEVGYNLEFIFDCDVSVAITVYYFATEDVSVRRVV